MPVSTNCATHSNYLAEINAHPRDKDIEFDEPTHVYTCLGEGGYTSVTTWNHSHFGHFDADDIISKMMSGKNWRPGGSKYYGMTPDQIKAQWNANCVDASTRGTGMHYDIECFYNDLAFQQAFPDRAHEHPLPDNDTLEFRYFKRFFDDYKNELKPYRTEMMVYDRDLKLAGSIDMIFENTRGELEIYDWKRCKEITEHAFGNKKATTPCIDHLPDSNFWHYSLQLNTYKAIIEKNYGKKVTNLCLVVMHPDNKNGSYLRIPVADLQEEIQDLFRYRIQQLEQQQQTEQKEEKTKEKEEETKEEEQEGKMQVEEIQCSGQQKEEEEKPPLRKRRVLRKKKDVS